MHINRFRLKAVLHTLIGGAPGKLNLDNRAMDNLWSATSHAVALSHVLIGLMPWPEELTHFRR